MMLQVLISDWDTTTIRHFYPNLVGDEEEQSPGLLFVWMLVFNMFVNFLRIAPWLVWFEAAPEHLLIIIEWINATTPPTPVFNMLVFLQVSVSESSVVAAGNFGTLQQIIVRQCTGQRLHV